VGAGNGQAAQGFLNFPEARRIEFSLQGTWAGSRPDGTGPPSSVRSGAETRAGTTIDERFRFTEIPRRRALRLRAHVSILGNETY
jgi:hypothetical protein